jgi:hypothetical protein
MPGADPLQGAGELSLDLPDIIDAGRPSLSGSPAPIVPTTFPAALPISPRDERRAESAGTSDPLSVSDSQQEANACTQWAARTGEEAPKACAEPLLCPPERASAVALRWLIAAR